VGGTELDRGVRAVDPTDTQDVCRKERRCIPDPLPFGGAFVMTTLYENKIRDEALKETVAGWARDLEKKEAEWKTNTHVEVRIEVGYKEYETYSIKKSDIPRIKHFLTNLDKQVPA
jgi:hypothetical protein